MVLIWIGIALGVLITSALIYKIMKSSKNTITFHSSVKNAVLKQTV